MNLYQKTVLGTNAATTRRLRIEELERQVAELERELEGTKKALKRVLGYQKDLRTRLSVAQDKGQRLTRRMNEWKARYDEVVSAAVEDHLGRSEL